MGWLLLCCKTRIVVLVRLTCSVLCVITGLGAICFVQSFSAIVVIVSALILMPAGGSPIVGLLFAVLE